MYTWHMFNGTVLATDESKGLVDSLLILPNAKIEEVVGVYHKWESLIKKHAAHYGVPEEWIGAHIWRESLGNEHAFRQEPNGWTGIGLMQITHPSLKGGRSDAEVFVPDTNISIGTRYLAALQKTYKGDFPKCSAAFNAGSIRYSDKNPWGMVSTGNHVDSEVRAVNSLILHTRQDNEEFAMRATEHNFDLTPDYTPHAY
jgi:soluble lytic murein transglycosylase-like protein